MMAIGFTAAPLKEFLKYFFTIGGKTLRIVLQSLVGGNSFFKELLFRVPILALRLVFLLAFGQLFIGHTVIRVGQIYDGQEQEEGQKFKDVYCSRGACRQEKEFSGNQTKGQSCQ